MATMGSQHAPASTYSVKLNRAHVEVQGSDSTCISTNPLARSMNAAEAVNIKSARTTRRVTTAIAATLPWRYVNHWKNAMPEPVPIKIVAETICSHLRSK